jgi:hypothetical protein
MIREFRNDPPASALGMFVESAELILGRLVARAHACVQSDSLRILRVVRHVVLLR